MRGTTHIAAEPTTGGAGWVVLATLMLATALANVATVGLYPQVVALSTEFGQPVNKVIWAMVVLEVIGTGVGGVAAALGATLGNRRMLVLTLGALLVGSVMAALSTNLALLIVGRAIQGVGMASIALGMGIIATSWRGEGMRRALSMNVLAMGVGATVGYLAGGLVWQVGGDWRTLFWLLGGGTAVDLILTLVCIKETERTKGVSIDYLGCIGLVAWAVLLLVPLSQANSWGWGSAKVVALLLSGGSLLVLWVLWELHRSEPLIDLRVLKRMGVWQGAVAWLVTNVALYVTSTTVPYLFQTPTASGFGFGRGILVVSAALAAPAVVIMLLSATTTPLMRRLGAKGTILVGMVFGLGGFGMAFAHGSVWINVMWLAAFGAMCAWVGSASYAVATEAVPPRQGVIVSTIYNTAGTGGAAVAAAIAGYVLTLREVSVETVTSAGVVTELFPAEETFTWSALLIGGATVIGIVCVLTIRSKELRVAGRGSDPAYVTNHGG